MSAICSRKRFVGWTLLELLLVLGCIIMLCAILLYSFMGPIHRQASEQQVASKVSRLVDAAHLWRHNHVTYKSISIDSLENVGLLPEYWGNDSLIKFRIGGQLTITPPQCTHYNCVLITIQNIKNACYYVIALHDSRPILTVPSYSYCEKHPEYPSNESNLYILYE